jgi:hypothetical protein
MKDVKIVIPSHKRATRVRTTSAVYGAALCVEESQADEYRKYNRGMEIITHPDSVIGLTRKRDWMMRNLGDIFMLDDDIDHLRRVYGESGEEPVVDPDVAYDIVQMTAHAARKAGAYLYGFAISPNPIRFSSLNPIQLSGYVTGCAHGVLSGSKLWYNGDIHCNEDFWISLLNAYHHRLIYKDTRFYWSQKDTFVNRGGLAEFRNVENEEKDFLLLRKVFGEVVELRKSTGKSNLRHPFQKTVKLPF